MASRKLPETSYKSASCTAYEIPISMFPICGMDQSTVDYLLATMSIHYKKYDVASKLLAGILTSQTAGRQIKDKALGLKEEVVAELRKGK